MSRMACKGSPIPPGLAIVGALVVGVGKLSDDRWWVLVDIPKWKLPWWNTTGIFFTSQINHPNEKRKLYIPYHSMSTSHQISTWIHRTLDPSDMEFDPPMGLMSASSLIVVVTYPWISIFIYIYDMCCYDSLLLLSSSFSCDFCWTLQQVGHIIQSFRALLGGLKPLPCESGR